MIRGLLGAVFFLLVSTSPAQAHLWVVLVTAKLTCAAAWTGPPAFRTPAAAFAWYSERGYAPTVTSGSDPYNGAPLAEIALHVPGHLTEYAVYWGWDAGLGMQACSHYLEVTYHPRELR